MKEKNLISKAFGPLLFAAGGPFMVIGISVLGRSYLGIILLIAGLFFVFTWNATVIDFKNKKYKQGTCFFFLFYTGKWLPIEENMSLRIRIVADNWQLNSLSNNILKTKTKSHHILLVNQNNEEIASLYQNHFEENVQEKRAKLATKLELKQQAKS